MDWSQINFNNIYQNDNAAVKWMQQQLGVKVDGLIGKNTIKALQTKIGTTADGVWGNNSAQAGNAFVKQQKAAANKTISMQSVPQQPKKGNLVTRTVQRVRSTFNKPAESTEVVPAAGMEDIPQVEAPAQTQPEPQRRSLRESISRTMESFGMHNSQNAQPITEPPQRDMSGYDVVFPENWGGRPSLIQIVKDSYYDMKNRNDWKKAVASHDGQTMTTNNYGDEVPQVNMNWKISHDQIARALALMPELNENSAIEWKGTTYDQTWDKPGYKESNQSVLTNYLESLPSNTAQMAVTSLTQPGRGTLGSFSYRTTPEGIEISDGYQFAADPSKLRSTSAQGEAYTEERLNMANNYRAANGTTQKYFIPWSAYQNIRKNYSI